MLYLMCLYYMEVHLPEHLVIADAEVGKGRRDRTTKFKIFGLLK